MKSDTLMDEVLRSGTDASASAFLDAYGARIQDSLRVSIRASLASPDFHARMHGVCRACVVTCHGADPEHGLPLSLAFLDFLRTYWRMLAMQPSLLHAMCGAAVNACVQVHYIEGKWDACRALAREAPADFPFIAEVPVFWNAIGLGALTLLLGNRHDDALAWMSDTPDRRAQLQAHRPDSVPPVFLKRFNEARPVAQGRPQAPRLDQALETWRDVDAFFRSRFEVETRRPHETLVRERLATLFTEQAKSFLEIKKTLNGMAPHLLDGMDLPALDSLIARIHAIAQLNSDGSIPFSEKKRRLAREQEAWIEDASMFAHPLVDRKRVNTTWVGAVINRAFRLIFAADGDTALAAGLLADLETAHAWCSSIGDQQTAWMANWIRLQISEQLADDDGVNRYLDVICRNLWEARSGVHDIESSSNIANHFPSLASKACKAHDRHGDIDTLMMGLELRKSRSLVACDADIQLRHAPQLYRKPEALGRRTHYLSYTALHHEDRIQAMLHTADGQLSTMRIDLAMKQLKLYARLLDPEQWRTRVFGPSMSVREALAPLMAPLAVALKEGRIQLDDHVCIAADDPVNLVPLHYLHLGDRPAVQQVSMSRVASFSDALRLSVHDAARPTEISAIFVPSVAKDIASRLAHFRTLTEATATWIRHSDPTEGALITRQDILERCLPRRVIHIHGHGIFKENQNPGIASGVLVSDGKHLPNIDGSGPLLTPRDVLQFGPQLEGSHVTLSACVSGMGLEGMGGDILGMEMALRLCGTSSLLATHWEVESDYAAAFSREFYRRWLGKGLGRAAAWRDTTNFFMAQQSDDDAAAQQCAFSLFGMWR